MFTEYHASYWYIHTECERKQMWNDKQDATLNAFMFVLSYISFFFSVWHISPYTYVASFTKNVFFSFRLLSPRRFELYAFARSTTDGLSVLCMHDSPLYWIPNNNILIAVCVIWCLRAERERGRQRQILFVCTRSHAEFA